MRASGRLLLLGSGGQVGTELKRSFAGWGDLICPGRHDLDIANEAQLRALIRESEPDLILNGAAYTAVDRAESEADVAMAVNAHAPRIMAEEAARRKAILVHYSTDYVFDGSKQGPWVETDAPNPLNVYGASKLAGERAIEETGGAYLILRTSWVYGPHGKNFLRTMLRLAAERSELRVVDDQIGAPTASIAIADATREVLDAVVTGRCGPVQEWTGIYHMTCSGSTSWFGFAQAIFAAAADRVKSTPRVLPIPSESYPVPARRPRNSTLSNSKLSDRFDIHLPSWESALVEALRLTSF